MKESSGGQSTLQITSGNSDPTPHSLLPTPYRKNHWRHGTIYGYNKKGCRCKACGEAKAKETARYMERNGERRKLYDRERYLRRMGRTSLYPLLGHGTRACYMRGCRREECVEAARQYRKDYKERTGQ